ncbi:hypothetical protein [Antrihabitans cavernicola]|uniref:Uncharacterized protein n=1 Tax=Antrihabitans cavernicola TaxID=2495913 RepID=A0A5A7S4Z8_9NOCA|nr:hypothetical protein [Spelaeibacter cavernicola]KAA0018527.1 hypothetical protein FOY51_23915 [Spelaeibacter cavernicola]
MNDGGGFILRKGMYRMVLSRARRAVDDPDDIEQLQDYHEGISLFRMEPSVRLRLGNAILHSAESLRADVIAGRPTEEPVRGGAAEYLTELIDFMKSHLSAD